MTSEGSLEGEQAVENNNKPGRFRWPKGLNGWSSAAIVFVWFMVQTLWGTRPGLVDVLLLAVVGIAGIAFVALIITLFNQYEREESTRGE